MMAIDVRHAFYPFCPELKMQLYANKLLAKRLVGSAAPKVTAKHPIIIQLLKPVRRHVWR